MQQPTQKECDELSGTRKRVLQCIPFHEWCEVTDLTKSLARVDGVLHDRSTIARICHGLAKSNFIEMRQRNKEQRVKRVPLYQKPQPKVIPMKKETDIVEALEAVSLELIAVQERSTKLIEQAAVEIKRLRQGDPDLQAYKEKYLKLKELLT